MTKLIHDDHPAVRWALYLIAIVVVVTALDLLEDIVAPLTLALVVGIVLAPLADMLERIGVPPAVTALLSLVFALTGVAALVLLVQPFVGDLLTRGSSFWFEARDTIRSMQSILTGLTEVTKEVTEAIAPGDTPAQGADMAEQVELPTVTDALLYAPAFAAQTLVFAGSLFFFLLSRHQLYQWGAKLPGPVSVEGLQKAEYRVSRYFIAVTTINAVFGVLVAAALMAIGMPSAWLWGLCAFLMNFILYLGPLITAGVLIVAGMMVFDGAMSFAPAAIYVTLNMCEGQFVTPTVLGRHMRVNPLLLFLSLIFWLWLWGPIGGFVAIPLIVWAMAVHQERHHGHEQVDPAYLTEKERAVRDGDAPVSETQGDQAAPPL